MSRQQLIDQAGEINIRTEQIQQPGQHHRDTDEDKSPGRQLIITILQAQQGRLNGAEIQRKEEQEQHKQQRKSGGNGDDGQGMGGILQNQHRQQQRGDKKQPGQDQGDSLQRVGGGGLIERQLDFAAAVPPGAEDADNRQPGGNHKNCHQGNPPPQPGGEIEELPSRHLVQLGISHQNSIGRRGSNRSHPADVGPVDRRQCQHRGHAAGRNPALLIGLAQQFQYRQQG